MIQYRVSERDFLRIVGLAELAGGGASHEAASALSTMRRLIETVKSTARDDGEDQPPRLDLSAEPPSAVDLQDFCREHGITDCMFNPKDPTLGGHLCLCCGATSRLGARVLAPDQSLYSAHYSSRGVRGWTHIECRDYWPQWAFPAGSPY